MSNRRDAFLTALQACIETAPEAQRNHLAQMMEEYALAYSRSYRDLTKGNTLVADLLSRVEESADCRIHRDACGLPISAEDAGF